MNKRVFQIDQECFIIFAEDLSSKKERFLRIGNSPFLKEFGETFTFLSLVTPLYPGNPFAELEIFRPNIDKKIIGLSPVVDKFISFLDKGGVDTRKVHYTYAEGQGQTNGKRITEDQFIEKVKNHRRLSKHSFAAFYNDGNIRIFNKDELMFDLKISLDKKLNERKEIELLSNFFLKNYKTAYIKSGIILSAKSLFIFSKNRFAVLSDSKDWVLDAIRVGIDPSRIDFIYLREGVEPDSLWLKVFLNKLDKNEKIRLVLKEKNPLWLDLVSDEVFIPLYPESESIEIPIGDVKLFFQNNRINIFNQGIKISFEGKKNFLDDGQPIFGEFIHNNVKNKFQLSINKSNGSDMVLYRDVPLIFEKYLDDNDFILKNKIDESNYNKLKQNKYYIERYLGIDKTSDSLNLYNVSTNQKLSNIPDDINPFTFFQKDISQEKTKEKFNNFKHFTAKNQSASRDQALSAINDRYKTIINLKTFYKNERERLKEFIEILDTEERELEEKEKRALDNIFKENNVKKTTDKIDNKELIPDDNFNAEEILSYEKSRQNKNTEYVKKRSYNFKFLKIVFLVLLILLLLSAISYGIFRFAPKIYTYFKTLPQKEAVDSIKDRYKSENRNIINNNRDKNNTINNNTNNSVKTSFYYRFFMTIIDNINLTNAIAQKNGYEKMTPPMLKKNLTGKDPDWIYPGNLLKMPDNSEITVKKGDNIWSICEKYLLNQINEHEVEIRDIILKVKKDYYTIDEAKNKLSAIKAESYSIMIKEFINALLSQNSFEGWEPVF
ncbi:MAG TPA: LysM peptidoglycan-binding domain-containing protein [Spirochaetota bacterium]|nr:LysM peptidoglycan-binding domain-containing protein [Spirochaetota bacterium]HOS32371.1 LysM peptidoglycan-binding domain-containing protein [Spirochaetota bacterium]HOS55618.1 LysM peptidoglycan-binding domain-containing protein [Spirochaetota bacterium]HQF78144.1 LysM peptidoglycan-binding domain-containing protein [Spirochaetota bacterium]HQH30042.1 LysM peptidoglycan-binding domain-containing protein [Spirochaetota bacterium]